MSASTVTTETNGNVRRSRKYAQVPDELIADQRVTLVAFRLWCRLDRYAGEDGRAFPSRATLAASLGVSETTIKRALGNLVQNGWITRAPRFPGSAIWDTTLEDRPRRRVAPPVTPGSTSDPAPGSHVDPPRGTNDPQKENHEKENQGEGARPRATPPDSPTPTPTRPRCHRHAELADDDPGPACVGCRDARLAAESATTARRRPPAPAAASAVLADMPAHDPETARRGVELMRAAMARQ